MTRRTLDHIGDLDLYLLGEGTHRHLADSLGSHRCADGGTEFAVWAPSALTVAVVGDFDHWGEGNHELTSLDDSGVWAGFVANAEPGHRYKFRVTGPEGDVIDKADPFATATELAPSTASIVADLHHDWQDQGWMAERGTRIALDAPVSIYEVHLGSWGRTLSADGGRFPRYEELADPLADHALAHGFTHIELLPVMEHPFYGSWGYQTTGYFAPTARYGEPTGLMAMIDRLHQREVGVILDWVPSHFPTDEFALARFDGTHLFEHADPRQGHHPDWDSAIFNYGRNEVRAFLISSALFWLDRYHADGLRVDAVASMLYLDYSRQPGEWIPNEFGGRENREAIAFLRQLNEAVYAEHPDVHTFAEESTAWPLVSRPTSIGGLGFGYKWDMGWMHDILQYLRRDPIHRSWHHDDLTFRSVYAFAENYTLPLSHDEVVHGKGSLLAKMPGDDWQQRANLRLLYGWQWSQPGKKLLFMGGELATGVEWDHESTLDWSLHDEPRHAGIRRWVADLNALYALEPSLHLHDADPNGFQWVEADDAARATIAFLRRGGGDARDVLVVANFTPTVLHDLRIGVDVAGEWELLANSDREAYGGSGVGDGSALVTTTVESHGRPHSLLIDVPPLGIVFYAPVVRHAPTGP